MALKLSIATITLNSEKTLSDTIESVHEQNYANLEYLIVDGGSTDRTLQIIEENASRICNWISEPDEGIYDAMNKSVHMATGDVVGLLNSDDLYNSNDVLSTVMKIFEEQPETDMVYGDLVYVLQDDPDRIVRVWKTKPFDEKFFHDGLVPPHPTLFVRREVYQKHCYLENFQYAADYEFMLRTFHKEGYKTHYLPKIMVRMRLGGQTNKSWKDIYKGNLEIIKAWRLNGLRPPLLFFMQRPLKKLKQFFITKEV